MKVTKENIKYIQHYATWKTKYDVPLNQINEIMVSLIDELEEINEIFGTVFGKLYIDYIDKHTEYSPERVDPCPDYYGMFRLCSEDAPYDSIGEEMTIEELDSIMCVLSDLADRIIIKEKQ